MASSHSNVAIASDIFRKPTYRDVPLVESAITILDGNHHEADVERAIFSILQIYFPVTEGWSLVPEFSVPELKRPDVLVEKYSGPDPSKRPLDLFTSKIFLELKSGTGDSFEKALNQVTSSLVTLTDRKEQTSIFVIVMKGKKIGFFEYHNDRSNLSEEGIPQYLGLVPFNLPNSVAGRPKYAGTGNLPYKEDKNEEPRFDIRGGFLDIIIDHVTVGQVLLWMKYNMPLNIT